VAINFFLLKRPEAFIQLKRPEAFIHFEA